MELEDLEDLINFTITTEKRFLLDELGKNASNCPDIHSKTILFLAKEHLWRPVPQSLNLMGQSFNWNAECSSKSEVSNLHGSISINE